MNWLSSLYTKRLLYLFSYIFISCLFYVIFISGIAFFHFLIDHSMMDIEAWVFDKSWTIFLMIKILTLFCLYQFISVKLPAGVGFFNVLKNNKRIKTQDIVGVLTLLFLTLVIVKPEFEDGRIILISKVLIAFFSSFFLFSLDSVLVYFLERIFPHSDFEKSTSLVIYSLLFGALNYFQFGSELDYLPFILIVHFFNFYFVLVKKSIKSLIFFNLCLTAPAVAILGLDPVWESGFSILEPQVRLNWVNMTVLIAIVISYWKWKARSKLDLSRSSN